jgi:hypothetical protein
MKEFNYGNWSTIKPKVFVSRPLFRVILGGGAGIYLLNSFRFYLFPRFYYSKHTDHMEMSVSFLGLMLEFMYNKHFK